jgi:hypothetical protein
MTYYRKNKNRKKNNRQLLIFLILALLFYFSFNLGQSKIQGNLKYCNIEVSGLQNKIEKSELDKIKLQKNIEILHIEKSLLQEKYDLTIPSYEALSLFSDINSKVSSGTELSRIKRVVDGLKNDRKCSKEIQKRFIVKTPLYKGDIKNTNISFEKGVFDITADGYSFINVDKRPESWFNADKPISVSFNTKKGTEVVKQELPIKKAIILNDKEYFFSISEADTRGFVQITEHSCNYP